MIGPSVPEHILQKRKSKSSRQGNSTNIKNIPEEHSKISKTKEISTTERSESESDSDSENDLIGPQLGYVRKGDKAKLFTNKGEDETKVFSFEARYQNFTPDLITDRPKDKAELCQVRTIEAQNKSLIDCIRQKSRNDKPTLMEMHQRKMNNTGISDKNKITKFDNKEALNNEIRKEIIRKLELNGGLKSKFTKGEEN